MPDTAKALIEQAYATEQAGDAAEALRLYHGAESICEDPRKRAHCLRHIGNLALRLGQAEEARAALRDAETLYREEVDDTLALANTVRLLAKLDDDPARWAEARALYQQAADETGLDLEAALTECDRHLRDRAK